jgi:tetratricopeptide (TPR) repeat protein
MAFMAPSSQDPQAIHVEPLLARAAELLTAGRPAEAITPLRDAVFLAPANPLIQHDLGLACLEVGRLPEAIEALQRAVSLKPRFADAHFRLGIALEKAGHLGAALVAYDRATELQPTLTEAWFRAGALVYTMGHRQEAIGCFRRAAASGQKTRFGRLGAARALLTEHRDAEAERVLRRALEADPDDAMAQDLLGNLLAESGRFDEAYSCFSRAIALAPLMSGCYYDLVRCRRVTAADRELIGRMQAALATPGLDVEPRLRVHLALGKAADDLGDYAAAMQQFDAADALRASAAAFDAKMFDAEVDRLIEQWSPSALARAPELGSGDRRPVLILGMPRSGTTLVEQIVSSHPAVRAGGELNFWNERGAAWRQAGAAGMERPFVARAAADYLALLAACGPKAARVTDKMPFNFLWAGLIHLAVPQATIIHCRRNPIDTALSIHQTLFNPTLAFPTGGPKLVAYYRSYERLTEHWRRALPPARFIEVRYEELTLDPEPVIRRIIGACGLGWHDACLHPEFNTRSVKTPSKWQTRQAIYRDSVERWRRYEPWLGALRALDDSVTQPSHAVHDGERNLR